MSEIFRIYLIYYIYIIYILLYIINIIIYIYICARFCIAARRKTKQRRTFEGTATRSSLYVYIILFYGLLIARQLCRSDRIHTGSRTCHRTITYSNYLPVYLIVVKDERKRSCGHAQFSAFAIVARAHHRRSVEISRSGHIDRNDRHSIAAIFFHNNDRSFALCCFDRICLRAFIQIIIYFCYIFVFITIVGGEKVEKEKKNNNKIKYFIISVDFIIVADLKRS